MSHSATTDTTAASCGPVSKQSATDRVSRRSTLGTLLGASLAAGCSIATNQDAASAADPSDSAGEYKVRNGRIRQSVVPWCFKPMPPQELIRHAARMGLASVELIAPEQWPLIKELGMQCAIASSHGFAKGFAHTEEHDECVKILTERIEQCAQFGVPNVITFSGMRRGLSDAQALRNMHEGLGKIAKLAERKKVTLCLEMLNTRVDTEMKGHPDYFCDNIDTTVEICRKLGSDRVKVLFDIYHVQIMHGDIITRIKKYKGDIAHYHTAGVPGRNEIDESQEINYPAIMRTIVETGYTGFVGQEFIPVTEKVAALNRAVRLCDV